MDVGPRPELAGSRVGLVLAGKIVAGSFGQLTGLPECCKGHSTDLAALVDIKG